MHLPLRSLSCSLAVVTLHGVGSDINGDKRPDLVCPGSGGVIRWYENLGPEAGR
jgi:hypothetical protein